AARHRPGRRDDARERYAELPRRQSRGRRPILRPVPRPPVSTDVTTSRVLVVGSANVDYAVAAPRLPRVGETVTGGTLLVNHGGKGANQAVAARRLGAEVRFVACAGDDGPGLEIRAALHPNRMRVAAVSVTRAAATATALIVIDHE